MLTRLLLTCLLSTPFLLNAQQIGAGAYWSMAICTDAVPRTWGSNSSGQLGDSTTTAHSSAAPVYELVDVVDMQGGFGHTVALAADSTVWCWGRNDYGGLGNGTTTGSIIPVQVVGLDDVIAIACGDFFSAALKADNTLWTWGHNNYGQLGTGVPGNSSVPVQAALSGITAIAAGNGYLLALKADSTVWGWGLNDNDQLGAGSGAPSIVNTAVQAVDLDSVVAISAGRYSFSSALRADGTVWTWGYNQFGQLGNGSNTSNDTPAPVAGLSDMVALARQSGYGHNAAVRNDGTLWTWGYNLQGQLGNGTNTDSNVPVQVGTLTDVVAVTCGDGHTLALKSDGTAWAFGNNNSGQLGNGTITDSNVPVTVTGICPSTIGLDEVASRPMVTLYPNPTDGPAWLHGALPAGSTASVHDALGKKVMDLDAAQLNGSKAIDLSGMPGGIYVLRVAGATGPWSTRVVVR